MKKYFYRLGHCSDLGLAEYEFLTNDSDYETNQKFLFADNAVNVQKTGSLVFGGKILKSWEGNFNNINFDDLLKGVEEALKTEFNDFELESSAFDPGEVKKVFELDATRLGECPCHPELVSGSLQVEQSEKSSAPGKMTGLPRRKLLAMTEGLASGVHSEIISASKKKLGLILPKQIHKQALKIAKNIGFKKINLLPVGNDMTFGNWKQTSNWLVVFPFQGKIILGRICSFSNQQFWSDIDQYLPHNDMNRGIINLKLARSLLNLTRAKNVWDPFCGQGRLMIGGLDLKKSFLASDIDKVCLPDVIDNYEAGKKIWQRNWKVLTQRSVVCGDFGNSPSVKGWQTKSDGVVFECGKNEDVIQGSVLRETPHPTGNPQEENLAIVTEGYLGTNFTKSPSEEEVKTEFAKLKEMWLKTLKEAEKLKIKELVFCLPFYKKDTIIPDFLNDLESKTGYKFTKLAGKDYVLYSREKTNTGHLIVRMELA